MGDRRPAEGLTDSALDREIDAALAVDPSPEFVARVRARIAGEPTPAPWWQLRWTMLVPVAGAAIVVIAAAMWWREPSPEQVASRAGNDVVLSAPSLERPVSSQVDTTPIPRVPRVQGRSPRALPGPQSVAPTLSGPQPVARILSGPREPEVLISRDEQRAFALLVAAVREGRIRSLPDERTTDASLEPADLALTPLVIEPLPQTARLEGDVQ